MHKLMKGERGRFVGFKKKETGDRVEAGRMNLYFTRYTHIQEGVLHVVVLYVIVVP